MKNSDSCTSWNWDVSCSCRRLNSLWEMVNTKLHINNVDHVNTSVPYNHYPCTSIYLLSAPFRIITVHLMPPDWKLYAPSLHSTPLSPSNDNTGNAHKVLTSPKPVSTTVASPFHWPHVTLTYSLHSLISASYPPTYPLYGSLVRVYVRGQSPHQSRYKSILELLGECCVHGPAAICWLRPPCAGTLVLLTSVKICFSFEPYFTWLIKYTKLLYVDFHT